jgi:hypothetical protein
MRIGVSALGQNRGGTLAHLRQLLARWAAASSTLAFVRRAIPRPAKNVLLLLFSSRYRRWHYALNQIWGETLGTIVSGPFRGMRYVKISYGSQLLPKLLGTYEKELHSTIDGILNKPYDGVVNIGAGEGYYVAGLGAKLTRSWLYAFESHKPSSRLLMKVAASNGIHHRLTLQGKCTVSILQECLSRRADDRVLVLCDVEGAEVTLLSPLEVPALTRADILVEIHGCAAACEMRRRFASTHSIEIISARPRNSSDWPRRIRLDQRYHAECLNEYRGEQQWFWMVALEERLALLS